MVDIQRTMNQQEIAESAFRMVVNNYGGNHSLFGLRTTKSPRLLCLGLEFLKQESIINYEIKVKNQDAVLIRAIIRPDPPKWCQEIMINEPS